MLLHSTYIVHRQLVLTNIEKATWITLQLWWTNTVYHLGRFRDT